MRPVRGVCSTTTLFVLLTIFSVAYCCPLQVLSDEPDQAPKQILQPASQNGDKAEPNSGDGKPAGKAEIDVDTPNDPPKEKDSAPAADQDQGEDVADPPPQGTPLGRFLNRLFLGDSDSIEPLQNPKKTLRADPRAPFNPKLTAMLKKAQTHFRTKEMRQCGEVLQKLLEQPEDALCEVAPGKLISVRTAAQRLLSKLPREDQDRYRLITGGQAQRELQQAQESGDTAKLAQVATKYFQTDAGYQAADQLASKYLDRGEFGLSAHWLAELWQAKAPCTKQPAWRLRAEFVSRMVPNTGLAKLLKAEQGSLPEKATIAGQLVSSKEWLALQKTTSGVLTPILDDWPQFFGTASRIGQASAGEPLLLKRWAVPLTTNPAVQEVIDRLINDLRDLHQAPILTFDPLLVDGKVIFRSLRGVQVADAQTGKLLWTTPDEPSADDLLSLAMSHHSQTVPKLDPFSIDITPGVETLDEMLASAPSDHPLTHLLFRNANHGLLSSDGGRLFVIEEQSVLSNLQPGRYTGEDAPDVDLFGRPLGINRLTAYDLKTGRSVWEVGGRELNDPFAIPLAGTFIFGPPVVDGGDLFVVNESDGEIRLHDLDPVTGKVRWSQLIAHAQAKINLDVGRQWFTSQVAVANGVVVCPTTVGWLVGVDRTTRNILWAYRYQGNHEIEPSEPHEDAVPPTQLNERWAPAPPVIVGNRVIFTPPESPEMVCLNLSDGELLWKRARDESTLFLAGVFGKQALVVGTKSITSLDIENKGKLLWTVKFNSKANASSVKSIESSSTPQVVQSPAGSNGRGPTSRNVPQSNQQWTRNSTSSPDARPAGRGVAVQDCYYLPLTSGELICVDLKVDSKVEDRIVTRLRLPASKQPELQQFGNLAMYRGMLVSLGSHGAVAFEPKLSIEAELQQQLAANPQAPAAVIRKAELELLHNQPGPALELLHELHQMPLTGELQQRYRAASVSALSLLVREDLQAHDAEFEELSQWAELPSEQQAREMLKAERYVARQNYFAAFEVYVAFANDFASATIVPGSASGLHVRGDRWASGKLEQMWKTLPPETAQLLDQRVRGLAEAAVLAEISAQNQFLTLFGFHPAAQAVRRRLVEALTQVEAWQMAENVLWDLHLDPEHQAWAQERMGRMWRQLGLLPDAAQAYQNLEREHPGETIDGRPAIEIVKELRDSGQLPTGDSKPLVNWRNRDLESTRSGSNFDIGGGAHVFSLQGTGLPYFQRHRIQYAPQESRFEVVDFLSEKRVWSIPLRLSEDVAAESVSARVNGHGVVIFGGGQVTALSPLEHRIIWSRPQLGRPLHEDEIVISENDSYGAGHRFAEPLRNVTDRFGRSGEFINEWSIFPRHGAPQFIANQRYVAYLARRQLVVLDALTGEIAWDRQDLPAAAMIRGGPSIIYVLDLLAESVTAYRAVDGSKLEIPKLNNYCKFAVDLVQDDLIRVELPQASLFGGVKTEPRLQRYNPLTQTSVWRVSLTKDIKATSVSGQRLVTLNPAGQLQLYDLTTGTSVPCGTLPAKSIRNDGEIRVVPNYEQLLVVANQSRIFPEDNFPESFPSIRVNGMVYAFDLNSGKEQWKQKVDGLHMILERLDHSPIVLFLSRRFQRNQATNWKLTLMAIDRFGGKLVHESNTPVQSSFHLLNINVPDAFVELRTYNDRLRLSPKSEF